MTIIVNDTFTDTNGTALTAHVGETGATWTISPLAGHTGSPTISGNALAGMSALAGNVIYYASGSFGAADYSVSAEITYKAAGIAGVGARLSGTNGYFAVYYSYGLKLYKFVGGVMTLLGTHGSIWQPSDGTKWRITIEVIGSSIKARAQETNNLLWLTPAGGYQSAQIDAVTVTDLSISSAGNAGFWFGNPSITSMDVFTADDLLDTTPPTLTGPTGTATGATTGTGTVSANEATGTLYRLASINATETAATVKAAAQTQAVSATGSQSVSFTGLTASTTYYAHYVHRDAAGNDSAVASSVAFTTSAPGDTTAPILTSPTGTQTGSTTGGGTVSTNEANGTLYSLATVNSTESAATIKASGATQTIASTGSKSVTFTGLTPSTTYYAHYVHRDAAGNDSAVADSGTFTTPAGSAATAVTMTLAGSTSGAVGVASGSITVGANGTITGTVVVTPSSGGGGGTFTPATVSISSGSPTGTFTYTPASTGAKTISATNGGGLSNPSSITYTALSGALYTRVDSTDPVYGQAIMVLVPSVGSANPYNSAVPTGVVMYHHGSGEGADALLTDSLKATCVNALLNAGYILAGSNAAGQNWGNQAGTDAYAGLDKYLRDNYNVKGVGLWSQSAGGPSGLSSLVQAKIKGIVGWLGTYPVCNLANMISLGTYASAINTAYGITGVGSATYANKTYGLEPVARVASDYRNIPMRFYASLSDTVVPGAQHSTLLQAIVAATRREATLVACSGTHGDPSHFVPSEYVAFFDRCFAAPVAATTRTVTITLTSDGTTPRASLSGLRWAFWNEARPDLMQAPASSGAGETTDGAGVLAITLSTTLASGGVGWLVVTDSDGTTTQSPAAKAFSGPVVVA